jgi:hypothetical protein
VGDLFGVGPMAAGLRREAEVRQDERRDDQPGHLSKNRISSHRCVMRSCLVLPVKPNRMSKPVPNRPQRRIYRSRCRPGNPGADVCRLAQQEEQQRYCNHHNRDHE